MNISLPIVAVAYNRPASLRRLLGSIIAAYYPSDIQVPLIISIDHSGSDDCLKVAEETEWTHGPKEIIAHQKNLGLRQHILSCGDIALKNDGVIILEDDCFVSKDFYNYALQTFEFYKDEPKVAGISLYSYEYNENAGMPFQPLHDGYDVYFKQVPSSLGQLWTKQQWANFRAFYDQSPKLNPEIHFLPENVFTWPESSWKKYYYLYIVLNDLYFVYPQVSHSTNFGDVGTHFTDKTQVFQVSLQSSKGIKYRLKSITDSTNIYDAFWEITPDGLRQLTTLLPEDICINTYGLKNNKTISNKYQLGLFEGERSILSFNTSLKPLINNVIYNNIGNGLSVIENQVTFSVSNSHQYSELLMDQASIPFNIGRIYGHKEIMSSRTYKLGRLIKNMAQYFIKFKKF